MNLLENKRLDGCANTAPSLTINRIGGAIMADASTSDSVENWKPVPGWEGLYEASSEGRIRSTDMTVISVSKKGTRRHYFKPGRVLRPGLTRKGYETVSLRGATKQVHRLVCRAFHGEPPSPEHHAAHNDGNRRNNAASNLRWASPKENQADQYRHGTRPLGERHPQSKLCAEEVSEIRRRASRGEMQADIAREKGLRDGHISAIVLRKVWRHIE